MKKDKKYITGKKQTIMIMGAAAVFLALTVVMAVILVRSSRYVPIDYPVYGFANMRGANGTVYRGIGGAFYGREDRPSVGDCRR
jgi:hypothetical protein